MIIDTTYLFPLAGVGVDTDLLAAIAEKRAGIRFEDLSISMISLFEIQAKNINLNIPSGLTARGIAEINRGFRVQPFYNKEIIEVSYDLKKMLNDYIDCIILATAIVMKEDLITEDSKIFDIRETIKEKFGIRIAKYADFVF